MGDKPPQPIRPSAIARHQLDLVTSNTRVKSINTLALPGIDVAREVALIDQGHGKRVGDSRYEINSRVYVVKPDGSAYPESGEGVVSVGPFAMALLRELIAHRDDPGVMALLRELIAHRDDPGVMALLIERNKRYTDAVVEEASWLFARWKGESRDAEH
jgi:hypothetical protein